MSGISRRSAIKTVGAGIAAASYSRILGANNDIRIAVIGVGSTVKGGGKGKQDATVFRGLPGVRLVGLCDPDHANLDPAVERFRKLGDPVEGYTDLRNLLDNKDIDAVSVTTPNHWHALAEIWACQAGKDVFVQKPASHNIFEGRKMVEAAAKYNRIVESTANSRSIAGLKEAYEWVRAGNLGKMLYIYGVNFNARTSIGKVTGPQPIPKSIDYDLWCGPAPVAPLMRECLHYDWHWQWPYGDGDMGNWGIHMLDGCRMATGHDFLARHVMSIGGRLGYVDDGQTPNSQVTFYDYDPVPIIFEMRGLPKEKSLLQTEWNKNYTQTMDYYRGLQKGTFVQCEGGYLAQATAFDKGGKTIKDFGGPGGGSGGGHSEHASFIKGVRSRKTTDLAGDMLQGHLSAALIHMGNISYRLGKVASTNEIRERIGGRKDLRNVYEGFREHLAKLGIDIDKSVVAGPMLTMDSQTERFTGEFSAEANALLSREYRKPFVVPEKI
jgi:hypothetical protein